VPILRTLSGSALMEGGSFAWIDSKTAVIGCGIRVNHEGAAQVGEVLKRQGVELIVTDLVGYDIHIDGAFLMVDQGLALINPAGLSYAFMEELKSRRIDTIEVEPSDYEWIVNALAVAPRKLLIPEGGSNRILDQFARHKVAWKALPYDAMHLNGGGIHGSTTPLIRDSV
jgi:N-dimethylarginine dimethylaminohydrolase